MSDDFVEEKKDEEESFADLFEAYSDGMNEDLQLGDKLEGTIISIGEDMVFIDTGTKIDGVVDRDDLLDENEEFPYHLGDRLDLYVVSHDGSEIRLSKTLSGIGNIRLIGEAFEQTIPVEGKVKAECKGGFQVDVMGKRAFCPMSQLDIKYVDSPEPYVGGTFQFLITKFDEDGRDIVVSRRELLKKEQEKTKKAFLEGIELEMQLEGRVTKLMPYGAFIELTPGLEGMVHISEISWSRIDRPEEALEVGAPVTVKVIAMEEGKRAGETKLALSIKQVTGDPWNDVENTFHMGDKITGKVIRCAKFGAFVEISPGVDGLVHISEMSYTKRVLRAEDIVTEGDTVEVMVKDIDIQKRRISLSIKDAEGDPWVDIKNKYKIGQSAKGTLENKEKFGYLVALEPGIVGLIPRSKIEDLHKPSAIDKLGHGDPITVIIERIEPEKKRISLIPGDRMGEEDWRSYTKDSEKSIGSLGEKLQEALKSKKE